MPDANRTGSPADFSSGLVLCLVAVFVLCQSLLMYADAGVALAVSPALLPFFLGSCLLICSVILLARTLRGESAQELMRSACDNARYWLRSQETDAYRILGGIGILGLYVFALIPIFEFWLSSSLFLITLMLFLRAASPVKIGLLTAGAVGGVILLFQVIFKVSLP